MKVLFLRQVIPFLCATALSAASPPAAVVGSEFIYRRGPYPSCHASTIVETASGGLAAAWFGGTAEGNPDVCIYLSRLIGGAWTPSAKVADGIQPGGGRYPCWNPVLFQPRPGPLLLFYKVGPTPEKWWGMMMSSDDGGLTWSHPRRLPPGVLGPIKDKPIALSNGAILCGSSTEDPGRGWQVHLECTSDFGQTWKLAGPINQSSEFNAIQPTLLTHPDGRLQMLCRTKEMTIATAWSSNRGASWTRLAPSGLYAPNSGIDAVTLADGRQLLVYNFRSGARTGPPAPKAAFRLSARAENWGARWPLNVALSGDGLHWKLALTLEDQPRPNGYAYPAVIQTSDGLVHITYTWNRQRIKHVVLDPRKL